MNKQIEDAMKEIELEKDWISTFLNYPFTEEDLAAIKSLCAAVGEDREIPEDVRARTYSFLRGISFCAYEVCLFGRVTQMDLQKFSRIIIILYNFAGMIDSTEVQQRLTSVQCLAERNLSLVETLDIMQQLARKLAPLLGHSSIETSASQLFLKTLDKHYSDLCEESRK